MTTQNQFQVGKTYSTSSACDSECIFTFTVISRTAKFVTLQSPSGEINKRKVWFDPYADKYGEDATIEHLSPFGVYSMSPVLDAVKDLVTEEAIAAATLETQITEEIEQPEQAIACQSELKPELTPKEKLQEKLKDALTEREQSNDKYWIDLEIEDLEEKINMLSAIAAATPAVEAPQVEEIEETEAHAVPCEVQEPYKLMIQLSMISYVQAVRYTPEALKPMQLSLV
jgi:hypothetical protein